MIISEISQHHLGMSLGSFPKLNCASLQTKPITLPGEGNTTTSANNNSKNSRKKERQEEGRGREGRTTSIN